MMAADQERRPSLPRTGRSPGITGMMVSVRVLGACSMGGAGHWNPLLPVLAAARRRGDEVFVIAPESMRHYVVDTGFAFLGGGEPSEPDVAPIRERLPLAPPEEAIILGNRELFGRLAARAMLPAMEETILGWRPDVVIRDPCEYASAAIAGRVGIPTAQVAISLARGEQASIEAAAPALAELRAGLVEQLLSSPYLTRFPASLDRSAFPVTVRYRDSGRDPRPLPDWWPASTKPLIYLSFGTVMGYLAGAATVYRTALGAVAELPVRVLLTVGRRFDQSSLGPLPPNVHVEAWVDQVDALAEADLVLCHGGSGTVYGALAAGRPIVTVPSFVDQLGNGRTVAEAGAGLTVEANPDDQRGPRRLIDDRDAPRITAAVQTVLFEPSYRDAARRIAAELAATPVIDDVLADLLTA